ncbi:MAG: hypothetical protein ABI388_09735 [Bacteroidia bacterium]
MKKSIIFLGLSLIISLCFSQAAPKSHPNYGGGKHTESHGGTYKGASSGSSHKGGKYKNSKTNNTYGRHKK